MRQLVASASLLCLAVIAVPAWGQAIQTDQKTVFINEHQVFDPGYAVGNLVIGSPDIADYKVMPGRRQLLIFGKAAGKTSFTIWDQNNVKRHEIAISVMTREDAQAETDLKDMLKDYPAVGVRRLRGELVITGTVDTEQDLEMVGKIAVGRRRPESRARLAGVATAGPGAAGGPSLPPRRRHRRHRPRRPPWRAGSLTRGAPRRARADGRRVRGGADGRQQPVPERLVRDGHGAERPEALQGRGHRRPRRGRGHHDPGLGGVRPRPEERAEGRGGDPAQAAAVGPRSGRRAADPRHGRDQPARRVRQVRSEDLAAQPVGGHGQPGVALRHRRRGPAGRPRPEQPRRQPDRRPARAGGGTRRPR